MQLSRPKGCDDVLARIQSNLLTYWANYVCAALVFLIGFLFLSFPSLVCVITLFAVWHSFLKRYLDPTWKLKVCRIEIGKSWMMAALCIITAFAFSLFVAPLLILVVPIWLVFVFVHGILHPIALDAFSARDCIAAVERGEMTRVLDAPEDEVAPASDQAE